MIIVTGANGQLGHDVVSELISRKYKDVIGIDINDLDITDELAVKRYFIDKKPDAIIHCAAYTAVDKAEDNREICMDINVKGTHYLVDVAKQYNAKFMYISTDYVFDGTKNGVYETIDTPNPTSVYGMSKYLGELEAIGYEKHYIVRISWVFGKNGNNFVKTMLRLASERDFINIVDDQIGSPTYTYDLSKLLVDIIGSEKYGTYHATNEDKCSWFEFAKEIFNLTHSNIQLNPISTTEYPTRTPRPMNSLMSKQSLVNNGFSLLPPWKDALKRYLKEIEVI